jgi:outer membrane protein, heavy metal efflux system
MSTAAPNRRPPINPSAARSFILGAACYLFSFAALAEHPLSAREVAALAAARAPELRAAKAAVGVNEAQATQAGIYDNPVLGWQREHSPGSDAASETVDTFALTVPVDISGRRGARRALARGELEAARSEVLRARSEIVLEAMVRFYEALAAARRAEILRGTVQRLAEAERVLTRRHQEGTVSGYERSRLEIEAELERSGLRRAEGDARVARIVLAAMLGLEDEKFELRGTLDTAPPRSLTAAPGRRIVRTKSLQHLRSSAESTARARESASSSWVPAFSVTGGVRAIAAPGETRYGYIAGIAAEIPIFSRGQGLRAEADARRELASTRVQAAERALKLRSVRAYHELDTARLELATFERATAPGVERLERAARSGYAEGERSILELLDAERARSVVELRRLELALRAKLAELELQAAEGKFE